jgi:hypothetical protein
LRLPFDFVQRIWTRRRSGSVASSRRAAQSLAPALEMIPFEAPKDATVLANYLVSYELPS